MISSALQGKRKRALEGFALDESKNGRQRQEIARTARKTVEGVVDAVAQDEGEKDLDGQRHQEGTNGEPAGAPGKSGGQCDGDEGQGDPGEQRGRRPGDGVAPDVQAGGVDAVGQAPAVQGELFAPFEPRGEVTDRFLSGANGVDVVRRALAASGPASRGRREYGRRKALIQGAGPEDVQIAGVGMVFVEELGCR